MLAGNLWRLLALGTILTIVAASAAAQQKVYKWVDEDGVVHYGDAPPEGVSQVESGTLPASRPAPAAPAAPTGVEASGATPPDDNIQAVPPEIAVVPPPASLDISALSLEELDRRCDDARETKIAPLREAEIEKCKQDTRNDPAWCERFNADFGEGGRTVSGAVRPRMFDDLPECVEALQERNRRGR